MTFRAHVAAYRPPWPSETTPELILDYGSFPGFSGFPVVLAHRKLDAILVRDGKPEATRNKNQMLWAFLVLNPRNDKKIPSISGLGVARRALSRLLAMTRFPAPA